MMPGFGCPLKKSSLRCPDRIALLQGEQNISYKVLNNRVNSAVISLKEVGVRSGMRVGILSENSIEYIILIFAIMRMGSLAVPMSFRFQYSEIEKFISGIGIDLVITDKFKTELVRSGIRHVELNEVNLNQRTESDHSENDSFEKGGTIILTSGSTGLPKGVLLSSENHCFSAAGSNMNIKLSTGDRWLLILPLYHVGGLAILFRSFLAGVTVSLPVSREINICKEIKEGHISHVSVVLTQLVDYISSLEDTEQEAPPFLKAVLAGGGYIPEALLFRVINRSIPVFKTYGLTEMSSQVTTSKAKVEEDLLSGSGSVLKYREISIGTGNEILVKGKTLFKGYISEGNFIASKTDENGWFHTGDIGSMGEGGILFLTGRKDNMFISGGENVFPEEIENELLKIENIIEAVVVPVEDEKFGNRPVAFIRTNGKKVSSNGIVKRLKSNIPGFKVPDSFYFLENIRPGQIKRKRFFLKELAETGKGLRRISD